MENRLLFRSGGYCAGFPSQVFLDTIFEEDF